MSQHARALPLVLTAVSAEQWQTRSDRLRSAHSPPGRNSVPAHISLFHNPADELLDAVAHAITARIAGLPP
jgi:hypothetical protein